MDEKAPFPNHYVPLIWAGRIVTRARKENRINTDYKEIKLMDQIVKTRELEGALINYDWVTVPLVYTQVNCQHYKTS